MSQIDSVSEASHSNDEESEISEEEIEEESHDIRTKANDIIATILEESDKLEEQEEASSQKKNGKQKLTKDESVQQSFWKLISDMQSEINFLKRSRTHDSEGESKKRSKIDTNNSTAYEPPCSSGYQKPKQKKQLSSVPTKEKQLSSATKSQQLKPAQQPRLSSE